MQLQAGAYIRTVEASDSRRNILHVSGMYIVRRMFVPDLSTRKMLCNQITLNYIVIFWRYCPQNFIIATEVRRFCPSIHTLFYFKSTSFPSSGVYIVLNPALITSQMNDVRSKVNMGKYTNWIQTISSPPYRQCQDIRKAGAILAPPYKSFLVWCFIHYVQEHI
jgi:hypothetical protein